MCVIIAQPKGTHLDKETAKISWDHNPDGGGFAYVDDDGVMQLEKYMEFEPFWKAFENARSLFPKRDFLLHMRIATHGSVVIDNVHPFIVNENTVMAHNGIIHGVPKDLEGDRSDTRVFIDEVLPELPANWLDRKYLVDMVEEWIGWSKLAFLTNDDRLEGQLYILNEYKGEVHDGMWFSNSSYKKPKVVKKWTSPSKSYVPTKPHTPIPIAPRTPVNRTNRDDYAEWWNSITEDARLPVGSGDWEPMDRESLPDNLSMLEKQIKEARASVSLFHDFMWDSIENEYVCIGCDSNLDTVTNECKCWSVLCQDCSRFAAECECAGGYSQNLIKFSDASEEVKNVALEHAYS